MTRRCGTSHFLLWMTRTVQLSPRSSPRKRGPSTKGADSSVVQNWIPAFAGMNGGVPVISSLQRLNFAYGFSAPHGTCLRIARLPCPASRAFARAFAFASPEGGGAPERRRQHGAPLRRRPACPCEGRRAFRRSTAAIFDTASALLGLDRRLASHVIRAALALPFIQARPAIEGSPLIGCGR